MRLITLLIPDPLLKRLDALVKDGKFPSRSEAIRMAIKDLLKGEGQYP